MTRPRGLACLLVFSLSALAADLPVVNYRQTGDRGLVFVNNPEYVLAEDTAEAGQVLYRDELAAGAWRLWASHCNGTTADLAFAVALSNDGTLPLHVTLEASAHGAWAEEFPRAWNEPAARAFDIPVGGTAWLLRAPSASPAAFLGGMVDFRLDRPAAVHVLVARELAGIDPAGLRSVGYVTRVHKGTIREARVYKGINAHTMAELELDWAIDDAATVILPVQVRPFDKETGTYGALTVSTNGWLTNIGIGHKAEAVMSDMFTFKDPAWPVAFDPATLSDATTNYPNVGNWAVVYRHHGRIANRGTRERRVTMRMAGRGLAMAIQSAADTPWRQMRIKEGSLDWVDVKVPPGQSVAYDGAYVLGGPSNGDIRHTVRVE